MTSAVTLFETLAGEGKRLALRQTALALGFAFVVVLGAWISRATEGRRALEATDAAMAKGDLVGAIVLARATATARCPWCEAPRSGFERLYKIAREAETRGDHATAVSAWRAVRAASLATSVLERTSAHRERADLEIARLEHRLDVLATATGDAPSPAASQARLRAALASTPTPQPAVFALLALGAALFSVGALRFTQTRAVRWTEMALILSGSAVATAGALTF